MSWKKEVEIGYKIILFWSEVSSVATSSTWNETDVTFFFEVEGSIRMHSTWIINMKSSHNILVLKVGKEREREREIAMWIKISYSKAYNLGLTQRYENF